MKEQLCQLHNVISVIEPQLSQYLDRHESGNMFFCFRWLLVLFKREFNSVDIMKLWEILWTNLPCKNFHLLFCAAILDTEKTILLENNYGFTEILKVHKVFFFSSFLKNKEVLQQFKKFMVLIILLMKKISLQHVNDLSLHIELPRTLSKAEGIYHQLMAVAPQLPDNVRKVVGLEPINEMSENSDDGDDQSSSKD